ncbi:PorP/SprF family type IX secretion system membrane protein [Psychroflexus sediminis]|uniref:Type IX secretion system membrane protein, PorP/SprF family n=1 Tax=Psychroflexus sediminis TaxID=470826 RepID=A0A1G7X304_9FLAO|nr:type IX secretion system membrane protein PorP/SprF [Psychroflexus sediminis]SDG78565.1 type IX secretion system membrane protein, PorP/SprF family [Psychroflexus sediminis]
MMFTSENTYSQRLSLPIYLDYLTDNYYLVHPSMAGASNFNKVRLTARQQWFDVANAPSLQTLSINGRVNDKVGLGAILYNDSNGRFTQQGAQATFAYHLMFSRSTADINQLSFGLSAGVLQDRLDQTGLNTIGNPDPAIDGSQRSETFFNVDVGVSYFFLDFFAHVTFKNLLPQQRQVFSEVFEISNQRQYLASVGYTIASLQSRWIFEPSLFFQHREALSQTNIDFNIKAYYQLDQGQIWGGISYRRALDGIDFTAQNSIAQSEKLQYISPFIGFNYKRFMVAYTYSHQAFSEVLSTSGFHQITLGYDFGENRKRQKCICPAVNY